MLVAMGQERLGADDPAGIEGDLQILVGAEIRQRAYNLLARELLFKV